MYGINAPDDVLLGIFDSLDTNGDGVLGGNYVSNWLKRIMPESGDYYYMD